MKRFGSEEMDRAFFEQRVVVPETPCWNWRGHIGRQGYGKIDRKGQRLMAHRAAYEMLVGPIPEDMEVHHRCCNRACVNPDHLGLIGREEHGVLTATLQTHCKNGHLRTPENTYLAPSGYRKCKECLQRYYLKRGGYLDPERQRATHCKNGHEYTPENTYTIKKGLLETPYRYCRQCNRDSWRRRKAKKAGLG